MKWLRTIVLFDQDGITNTDVWRSAHESYVRSIQKIDHPRGSGTLTLRHISADKKDRNGVPYLKNRFVDHMRNETWLTETPVVIRSGREHPHFVTYPDLAVYQEPVTASFGSFDFTSKAPDGTRIALEWETGNISSSHRSLNKLCIALANGDIQIGVLIVPSRNLYVHLTDRIGNIAELSPYLAFWQQSRAFVARGLLALTVVEHDFISHDPNLPYLKTGDDGRARQARIRRR